MRGPVAAATTTIPAMNSTRDAALGLAHDYVDDGAFEVDLARRVAHRTESQLLPDSLPALRAYIDDELVPAFAAMGFETTVVENPVAGAPPALLATRHERDDLPTVLSYGHGDVIVGQDDSWTRGDGPWNLARVGDRLYGRGTADNKAQHTINMAALGAVIAARGGDLGFNAKYLIEMGEEAGSAGLEQLVAAHRDVFAADVLIASDGPRVRPDRPTMSLGCRGAINIDLVVDLRDGAHHSGNWGGLIADPGLILANALASIVGPTGELLVTDLLAVPMTDSVRACLDDIEVDGGPDGPRVDEWWGQPGLTPAQRVFAANTFNVLAFVTGNPEKVVNAIQPRAVAHCQLRMVAGTDPESVTPVLRRHLDDHGFEMVRVDPPPSGNAGAFPARRTEPDHPWATFVRGSMAATMGAPPAVLPSIGGSVPNHVFTDVLGLPTIWIPHSYPSCSQHAPDEHVLVPTCRSGLEIMAGLFSDIAEHGGPPTQT
jgi:acetylornithine deacetylase/succinyl-diaminopimelate desuccinylase-like protein